MISALRKIEGHAHVEAPSEVREMFIENPHAEFAGLFATHPPIAKRIEALIAFAGGRDAAEAARASATETPTAKSESAFGKRRGGPWG
jgi:heat shock protein HtpX